MILLKDGCFLLSNMDLGSPRSNGQFSAFNAGHRFVFHEMEWDYEFHSDDGGREMAFFTF